MQTKIKNNRYECVDCGNTVKFIPTLKERGLTSSEAKVIFYDTKGGRCVDCFIAYRNHLTIQLIRKNTYARIQTV